MSRLLLAAPVLSLAVLAAHFYRGGAWWMAIGCIVVALLLSLQRAWTARLAQVALLLGTAEWLWTVYSLAQQRVALGQPWTRLSVILGSVALFTAMSALVFRNPRVKSRYGLR